MPRSTKERGSKSWLSDTVFCEHGESPKRDVFVGGCKIIDASCRADEDALRSFID
jgi:formimidoylglutamate deiminase